MATMINCPYCGKLTDPQLDSCVHCGGFLKKQSPRAPRKSSAPSQTCPSCGALVRDGDFICVACGTNLLTGQKIAEERKKAGESRSPVTIILSVVAAAVIVLAGAAAIYVLTRDPVVRAQKLSAAGRTTEAVSLLENHLAKKPKDGRAQFALGTLYWTTGDFQAAAKAFEQASQLDAKNRQAGIYAVLSHAEMGKQTTLPAQIAVLEQMVQHDPSDAEAQYLLGLARASNGDYLGAVDALRQSAPGAAADPERQEALGVGLALDKQYPDAERELKGALEQQPGDADVLAALGFLAGLQGNDPVAEGQLQAAVSAGTSVRGDVLTQLGLLAIKDGKYPEARVLFSQALEAGSNDPAAKYFHAVCLAEQGSAQEATAAFDEISGKPGPFAAQAAMQSARLLLKQQAPDRALEALNRITANLTGTQGAELETLRGRVLVAVGNVDGALDAFRKAGQLDAGYPPVHLENGLLQINRGNMPEGLRELQRYLDLVDKNDPDAGVPAVQGLIDQLKQSAQAESSTASAATRGNTQGGRS